MYRVVIKHEMHGADRHHLEYLVEDIAGRKPHEKYERGSARYIVFQEDDFDHADILSEKLQDGAGRGAPMPLVIWVAPEHAAGHRPSRSKSRWSPPPRSRLAHHGGERGEIDEGAGRRHARAKTAQKRRTTIDDTVVEQWDERDRTFLGLKDKRTDEYLVELWDDDAREAVEDGFIDPRSEMKLHKSLWEYYQARQGAGRRRAPREHEAGRKAKHGQAGKLHRRYRSQ